MTATDTRNYTWRIEQGERERLNVPIFDDADEERDVTGWTVDAVIRTRPGGEVLYTFPEVDITITGNDVKLVVPGPVSAEWDWLVGWFRIRLTAPNSTATDPDAFRVIQGWLGVDPD